MKKFSKLRLILLSLLTLVLQHPAGADECQALRERYRCPQGETYPLHLTFDDGPHPINTPKVLQALKKHAVAATFFVVGERLEAPNPEDNIRILRQIQAEGHVIGSHSYRHEAHTQLTPKKLQDYIQKSTQAGLGRVVDGEALTSYLTPPPLLRLPYGDGWHPATLNPARAAAVMSAVHQQGFHHVGWDLHAWDWDRARMQNPGILPLLMQEICKNKGGIVLLHDIQSNTADNLDAWITAMKCVGHTFTGIASLIVDGPVVQTCPSGAPVSPAPTSLNQLQQGVEKIVPHLQEAPTTQPGDGHDH